MSCEVCEKLWVPCERWHLDAIELQLPQIDQMPESSEDLSNHFIEGTLSDFARTALVEGRPIGAIGVIPFWTGVCQAWACLSDEILASYAIHLTRQIPRWIKILEEQHGMWRIQAVVDIRHAEAERWASLLGFEGSQDIMKAYGPNREDFRMYARVRNWVQQES